MAKLSSLLQQRFRKKEKPKMAELAEKTSGGQLTVFSGVFNLESIGEHEKEEISTLLEKYAIDQQPIKQDLSSLLAITSEVKAINNQAAILHGERIKRAQTILKRYKEGAFTSWLLTTYGNRQTPYNFLQYYEFYNEVPKQLRPKVESMPRQAVYTLASRDANHSAKEEVVRNYGGETKQQMISIIRTLFPVDEGDGRKENPGDSAIRAIQKLIASLENKKIKFTAKQKQTLHEQIDHLYDLAGIE